MTARPPHGTSLLLLLALAAPAAACGGGDGDDDDDVLDPLTVTITAPAEGAVLPAGTTTVSVTATGAPDEVRLLVDGVDRGPFDDAGRFLWVTDSFDDGAHTLVAEAARGAERAESAPVSVSLDKVAPRIVNRAPVAGEDTFELGDVVTVELSEPVTADPLRSAIDVTSTPATCSAPPCAEIPIELGVTLEEGGRRLVAAFESFPRTSDLPVELRVRVGTPLADLAGNPLDTMGAGTWVFTAPAWLPIGDAVFAGDAVRSARLVGGPDGSFWMLALTETAGIFSAELARLDGFWVPLGQVLDDLTFEVRVGDMVVDRDGVVVIGLGGAPFGEGPVAAFRRWDGIRFSPIPAPAGLAMVTDDTRVVALEMVRPAALLAEEALLVETLTPDGLGGSTREVRLYQLTITGSWVPLAEAVPDTGAFPRLALDSRDRPVVGSVVEDPSAGTEVRVVRWNGGAYVPLGAPIAHAGGPFALAVDELDRLYLGVRDGTDVDVHVYEGSAWRRLPGSLSGASPELAITADGSVVLGTTAGVGRWEREEGSDVLGPFDRYGSAATTPSASEGLVLGITPDGRVVRGNSDGGRRVGGHRFNFPPDPAPAE